MAVVTEYFTIFITRAFARANVWIFSSQKGSPPADPFLHFRFIESNKRQSAILSKSQNEPGAGVAMAMVTEYFTIFITSAFARANVMDLLITKGKPTRRSVSPFQIYRVERLRERYTSHTPYLRPPDLT